MQEASPSANLQDMKSHNPIVDELVDKVTRDFLKRRASGQNHPIAAAGIVAKELSPKEVAEVHQAVMELLKTTKPVEVASSTDEGSPTGGTKLLSDVLGLDDTPTKST